MPGTAGKAFTLYGQTTEAFDKFLAIPGPFVLTQTIAQTTYFMPGKYLALAKGFSRSRHQLFQLLVLIYQPKTAAHIIGSTPARDLNQLILSIDGINHHDIIRHKMLAKQQIALIFVSARLQFPNHLLTRRRIQFHLSDLA